MLYGMRNVPGAPGDLLASDPSFKIGPRSPFKGMSQKELEDLKTSLMIDREICKSIDDSLNGSWCSRSLCLVHQRFPQLPMAGSPFGSSNLYGAMAQMGGRYDPSAPGNGAAMSNLPNGANAANATFYRGLPPGFTKTVS
jgi:hypothetical protein